MKSGGIESALEIDAIKFVIKKLMILVINSPNSTTNMMTVIITQATLAELTGDLDDLLNPIK